MDIRFKGVSHIYNQKTPLEVRVLHNVDLEIKKGQFTAIVGHTGSGKSTLIQHMNALLKPTHGEVCIGEKVIRENEKAKNLKAVRQKVGLVFQFPEYQLFEETVEKDIMFGPMNYGMSAENAQKRAKEVLQIVGLDEAFSNASPFGLSGGQMRRVAIAGILAMDPDVLILDEPTAGLDPHGQKEIMNIFKELHEIHKKTIILVSHDMDLVSEYAQHMIVMHRGKVKLTGSPKEVFKNSQELEDCGITLPIPARNYQRIAEKLGLPLNDVPLTVDEFIDRIAALSFKGGA
ncbi:MAG: energy-coupling factor ABC transporter ATP-binding protein [Turicibacter sp.]|nr:energy-coupling factor ABC transporter ATP-binding protein [Turicibacter sp.]